VSVIYKRESVKAFPKNVLHAFVLLVRNEEAPLALGKERDAMGGMASVEKEILTSAVHSSSIVGNEKTPRESGTSNMIETGRFETPVGSA